MKKLSFLTAVICAIVLISSPMTSTAGMIKLNNADLSSVTGQSGINFSGDNLDISMKDGLIYFTDTNGVDGNNSGTISLTDTFLKGSISAASGIELDVAVQDTGSGQKISSTRLAMEDAHYNIESFHSDVRLGSGPGLGNSFGVVGIQNLQVRTTGSVIVRVN
jgi:hypothetical protein